MPPEIARQKRPQLLACCRATWSWMPVPLTACAQRKQVRVNGWTTVKMSAPSENAPRVPTPNSNRFTGDIPFAGAS